MKDPENVFPAAPTQSSPETRSTRDFFRIVSFSTALGFGFLAASMASLRSTATGFAFQYSPMAVGAFAFGAGLTVWYWRLAASSVLAARLGGYLLATAGLALFFYPLRFVPAEKLPEIASGLALAVCALAIGASLLLRVKRFLESDALQTETPPGKE